MTVFHLRPFPVITVSKIGNFPIKFSQFARCGGVSLVCGRGTGGGQAFSGLFRQGVSN